MTWIQYYVVCFAFIVTHCGTKSPITFLPWLFFLLHLLVAVIDFVLVFLLRILIVANTTGVIIPISVPCRLDFFRIRRWNAYGSWTCRGRGGRGDYQQSCGCVGDESVAPTTTRMKWSSSRSSRTYRRSRSRTNKRNNAHWCCQTDQSPAHTPPRYQPPCCYWLRHQFHRIVSFLLLSLLVCIIMFLSSHSVMASRRPFDLKNKFNYV